MDKKKDKKQNPNEAQQPGYDDNAHGKDLYDNNLHNEENRQG